MKNTFFITFSLLLIIVLVMTMALPVLVSAQDEQTITRNTCVHLHRFGYGREWLPDDQGTAVGAVATFSTEMGYFYGEDLYFRRMLGTYWDPPENYVGSDYLNCYIWMDYPSSLNLWPESIDCVYWDYLWVYMYDDWGNYHGAYYYTQSWFPHFDNYVTFQIYPPVMWYASESWFDDALGDGWWDCFSYVVIWP